MALDDDIHAVNAWADYVAATPMGQLNPRTREERALRSAALKVLEAAQDWPEVERRDGQHLVLQAPDGSHVLYTYAREGDQFVERLSRVVEGITSTRSMKVPKITTQPQERRPWQ